LLGMNRPLSTQRLCDELLIIFSCCSRCGSGLVACPCVRYEELTLLQHFSPNPRRIILLTWTISDKRRFHPSGVVAAAESGRASAPHRTRLAAASNSHADGATRMDDGGRVKADSRPPKAMARATASRWGDRWFSPGPRAAEATCPAPNGTFGSGAWSCTRDARLALRAAPRSPASWGTTSSQSPKDSTSGKQASASATHPTASTPIPYSTKPPWQRPSTAADSKEDREGEGALGASLEILHSPSS
jgi:hypothetical protein